MDRLRGEEELRDRLPLRLEPLRNRLPERALDDAEDLERRGIMPARLREDKLPRFAEDVKWAQPVSIRQINLESSALGSEAVLFGAGWMGLAANK